MSIEKGGYYRNRRYIPYNSRQQEECLPGNEDFVAKPENASFDPDGLFWEASTLPLSYTRPNRSYFSPKIHDCKGGSACFVKKRGYQTFQVPRLLRPWI